MIVFDLHCLASGDRFEAWFRSNADFEQQLDQGQVQCPFCRSSRVAKAPMAPIPKAGSPIPSAQPRMPSAVRVHASAQPGTAAPK